MENKTYYEILGVSPKCTQDEIKVAYRKLIKKFHPDKCNDESDVKHTKAKLNATNMGHVKLINKAYEILKNSSKRNDYDNSLKVIKKKGDDFLEMKQGALDFFKTHEMSKEELAEAKLRAEKEYAQKSRDMDRKMGINNQVGTDRKVARPPTTEELERQISQLETLRDQEYIENIPSKICDEKDFNITRFNDVFDSIAEETNSLIQYTGNTLPYNEIDACKIDEDDNVQTSEFLTDYSGKKIDMIIGNSRKNFVVPTKSLEDMVEERNRETQKLLGMKMYEFNKDECINASGSSDSAINWLKQ